MTIRQGLADGRQYQLITLANGLQLTLISDPKSQRSACAMAVRCGYFDDPAERAGLSHLLEHMLFLGTEPYPRVGSYHKFIDSHGGHHNAWTGTEQSCYFLEIDNAHFDDALRQFGPFFYAPLLEPEWIERERQAIDAEYRAKLRDEGRRLLDVHKASCNPDHPFAKFAVGNADTLAGGGRELSELLRHHFEQHFHGASLNGALLGPQPLSELAELAVRHFGAVRPGSYQPPTLPPLYRDTDLGIRIDVTPLKHSQRLSLVFPLPPQQPHYRTKPTALLAHLIGEESPTSLLAALQRRGWVNQLNSGVGVRGSNYYDFAIDLLLTDDGATCYQAVVEQLFAHLETIRKRGLDPWRYQERAILLRQQFDFAERGKAVDIVQQLALNQQIYPAEDLILGDYRMDNFDRQSALGLLDLMTAERCRLIRLAPGLPTLCTSPWYQAPYAISPLPARDRHSWQHPGPPLPAIQLAERNPYVVERLQPYPLQGEPRQVPERLEERDGLRLWHHQDHQFRLPKGYVYISLDSPRIDHHPRHIAMLRAAVELRNEQLAPLACPAEAAGLHHSLYAHQCGFTLSVGGFSCRQATLIDNLVSHIWQRQIDEEAFERVHAQLLHSWRNARQAPPLTQLFAELSALVQPSSPLPQTLADALETVSAVDLQHYLGECEKQLHLEILVSGDWTASDARLLGSQIASRVFEVAAPTSDCPRELINIGGYGSLTHQLQLEHNDSALVVYYQSPLATPLQVATFAMLNHLIASPFFHELRTRRQLGYMIGTGYLPMNRHPGLVCYLQSPTVSPQEMLTAVDEFLGRFGYALLEMTDQQWHTAKQTLAQQFTELDTSLRMRAQNQWVSIGNKDFSFNQRQQVAAAIDTLDRNELLTFVMDRLKRRNSDRLVIAGTGQRHRDAPPLREGTLLNRTEEFRLTAERFVIR